jgi:hypothetical protein
MNDLPEDKVRSAWSGQPERDEGPSAAKLRMVAEQRDAMIRKRDRRLYVSASIIIPAWVAAFWLMPDLRLLATSGFALAVWLIWQQHRRSAARLGRRPVDLPCIAFQRDLLQHERNFYAAMPRWFLAPVVGGQIVIVATLLTNPRFEKNQMFPVYLAMFIGTVITVLVIAWRRWQREVLELELEIASLDGGLE